MLASLWLDDLVVVRNGGQSGPETYVDVRDSSFHREDGWDIRETLPGVFSLHREGMASPVTVGGYGYSYTTTPEPEPVIVATDDTGKRRKR